MIRAWIYKWLPAWAKDTLLRENEQLRERVSKLKAEKAELQSYIDGLESGIRGQRKIIINIEGKEDERL